MERRTLLRLAAGAGAAALLPGQVWRDLAVALGSPAVPGAGPYGPLGEPDANGIRLPAGFASRLIAVTGEPVGDTGHLWHGAPDGGGCVPTPDGGWIYVSNAELENQLGGVSAVRFAPDGSIVDAYPILTGTSRNCAGGVTPWNTWLSCEEAGSNGEVFECDPYAEGQGTVRPALGRFNHEAAAVDPATGHVYLTEDMPDGRLYRFEPLTVGDLSSGALFAAAVDGDGSVSWIPCGIDGPDRNPLTTAFDGGEGIYHGDGVIWFATKGDNRVWELDLATQRVAVAYDCNAHPGGRLTDVDNVVVHEPSGRVFVAEDAGDMELGVLAGPPDARTMSIVLRIEGHAGSEVTGIAFSPDGSRLYVSSQRGTDGFTGRTYEITGPWDADLPEPPPVVDEVLAATAMGWVRGGSYANSVMDAGRAGQICFNGTETYSRRTFVTFRVDPDGGDVEAATLELTSRVWTGTGAFVVEPVATGWDPATLTWNTQPAVLGAVVGGGDLDADARRYQVDVSGAVAAAVAAGDGVVSFAVRQSTRNGPLGYVDQIGSPGAPSLTVRRGEAPPPPPPPPVTTTPVAIAHDTWVRGGTFADASNESSRLLQVCNNGSEQYTRWAYLGVEVPPLAGTVRRATLRVNARLSSGSDSTHEVLATPTEWFGNDLTWNGRPIPDGAPLASFDIVDATSRWYELDVTAAVADVHAAGGGPLSLVVRQVERNGPLAYINPTNHWTSDVPELVVEHG